MAALTKLPSGSYRVRIRRTGTPPINRTFSTRKAAQTWADEQEGALAGGAALPLAIREYREAKNLTMTDLFNRYFESWKFKKKATTTQSGERTKSKPILKTLGQHSVVRVTSALVSTYRDVRMASKTARGLSMSPDQVRLEMALLSTVLGLAASEWQIIPANPCKGVEKPAGTERRRRLSEDEERKLRVALIARDDNRRLLRFALLAFYTGMRAGELAQLQKTSVNLTKKQIILDRTKNTEQRLIPISDEMVTVLRRALATASNDSPYVFTSVVRTTGDYQPYLYGGAWRETLNKAGIKNLRFHDLRHEFVSRLFEQTQLSDGQIAALSGHKSPQALWRYKHLRSEQLRPVVEAHSLELIQRDLMHKVEADIHAATLEAVTAVNPDWDRISKVLGAKTTRALRKRLSALQKPAK